jgi:hypothetical protein
MLTVRRWSTGCVVGAVAWGGACEARAATIVSRPYSFDRIVGEIQATATTAATGYTASANDPATGSGGQIGVGGASPNQTAENVVLGFLLPTLSAGESFASVTLRVTLASRNGPTASTPNMNGDLYGLGAADPAFSPDASGTSLYFEAAADATQTKVADNFFTPANTTTTNVSYPTDVTGFVSGLYAGGTSPAGGRAEVFFRLNPDNNVTAGTINRYSLSTTASTVSLTYEVVPEPAAAGVAAAAGLGLLARRPRRASGSLSRVR